jgi:hypothetical protein
MIEDLSKKYLEELVRIRQEKPDSIVNTILKRTIVRHDLEESDVEIIAYEMRYILLDDRELNQDKNKINEFVRKFWYAETIRAALAGDENKVNLLLRSFYTEFRNRSLNTGLYLVPIATRNEMTSQGLQIISAREEDGGRIQITVRNLNDEEYEISRRGPSA